MKRLSVPLLLFLTIACTHAQAQQTQKILKKSIVDHFFSCPLDEMLDTLSLQYKVRFIFEREPIHGMDVVEHFFNEPLIDALKLVCKQNDLQYWIENDGTIYILQQPDDLDRLKQLNAMNKSLSAVKPKMLEPPKGPPTRFMFSISGRVVDQNTGEALPGAIVSVRNSDVNTATNTSGNFTLLNVPADTCVLEVSYMGYQPDKFRLDDEKIKGSMVLPLFPSMNALNEVVITDKKHGVINTDSKKVSVLQLTPAALDKLPNIGERDILRSFQLMPGVSGTNESSSGAYVRGGTPDQNLVTFDGFTVYQVDHLYGFYSAFNPNAVRDVEMYKGGFSSKYGGRLSAVTEIRGKDGNKNETNFGGDLSLLSINLYGETPLNKNSSFLVAFRRSYQGPLYDKIFGQFNKSTTTTGPGGGGPGGGRGFMNQTTPSSYFYDFNAKYTYSPSDKNTFSWTYYSGTDHLDNSRDLNFPSFVSSYSSDLKVNDYTKSGNIGTSGKWVSTWGKKLFSNTVISYSQFNSDRDRGTTGTVTDSGTTTNINNGTYEYNRLKDLSLKSDWEWQAGSKYKVLFGGYGSYLDIKYRYTQNDTTSLINQHNNGAITGGYTELQYDPNSDLHIQPGIRETYYSPTGKIYTEPRLSATYHFTDRFNLKMATGRFYQFTNRVTREDILNGDRNFWVLADKNNMPVSSANHYIAGFNYETKDFLIDIEGYYKQLNGLTEYSIRQQGGGPFNASTTSTITENYYTGNGWAKGIEVLLQKKVGVYTGWIAYTLAQSKSKFAAYGNDYFPSDQDVRNEFKWINMYHLQRWSFAATWIFSTGHPYTAPLGSYTINTVDGNKVTYLTISDKNAERLPAYHRLDLSATYDLLKVDGRKIGSIGFSLFNAYNHINTWYKEYTIQNNQVVTSNVNYLGLTPNITLSLRWK
ncbi:TonB-dependent receptor [Mucilaginibacter agri]|uniref:TonB-dependent receptor n=1 Tax=Mucilaginibacter agri TaxID=2695265 RepID=A0A965ZFF4_9SPHI|nr:carboxypeptidase-like regulatory domain-containing protein [Mucilaginibacter agri]NCD69930.1 TonB-dependent receptor [Mucilaginibacter agri]